MLVNIENEKNIYIIPREKHLLAKTTTYLKQIVHYTLSTDSST